jgi:transposase
LAAIRGDKTLAEWAEHFAGPPNQIAEGKHQLTASAAAVFGGTPRAKAGAPDLKVLHAKIGPLTLEHDC